jgi:hypothetical protein
MVKVTKMAKMAKVSKKFKMAIWFTRQSIICPKGPAV